MNPRRLLVLALGAALSGHAALLRAQSPTAKLRRVGVLVPSKRANSEVNLKPFFDQMRELGWIEGRTIAYDRVYADDQQQNLTKLAAELVARAGQSSGPGAQLPSGRSGVPELGDRARIGGLSVDLLNHLIGAQLRRGVVTAHSARLHSAFTAPSRR